MVVEQLRNISKGDKSGEENEERTRDADLASDADRVRLYRRRAEKAVAGNRSRSDQAPSARYAGSHGIRIAPVARRESDCVRQGAWREARSQRARIAHHH